MITIARLKAFAVHCLTASCAVIAIYTLYAIAHGQYLLALILMGAAIIIDAVDGTLARAAHVKTVMPRIDGALLDNIVDYMNYVLTPCFLLMMHPTMLNVPYHGVVIAIVLLTSAYQFTQIDAKTTDNFFRGFPCYWNIVVYYQFVLMINPHLFAAVLLALSAMIFVPIKYVYLSRMDYLPGSRWLKPALLVGAGSYGIAILVSLVQYPLMTPWVGLLILGYPAVYFLVSLYCTCVLK